MAATNTIADILALVRHTLNDAGAAVWSDATLTAWIIEAIRDYAVNFKRLAFESLSLLTGDHTYHLPYDCMEIILVEYPYNPLVQADPPTYLDLLSRKDPAFWESDRYYDFEPAYQEQSEVAGGTPPILWLSAGVTTGENAYVTYHSTFYDATDCLVPDHHIPLLIMFVQWKAAAERLFTELQGPDYNNIIIGHIRGVVQQAREAYERAMHNATAQQSRGRWTEPWRADDYDAIY